MRELRMVVFVVAMTLSPNALAQAVGVDIEETGEVQDPGGTEEKKAPGPKAVKVPPNPVKCSGFGLLTPLFGVSNRGIDPVNPNKRSGLRVTGPIESGIGGGYFWPFPHGCHKDWAAGAEVFGFSEGLNPSSKFHIGAGAGVQLTVLGKFSFGIALGYDLVRLEVQEYGGVERTYENGLLIGNDVFGCDGPGQDKWECSGRNFTWLLTFGLSTDPGSGS